MKRSENEKPYTTFIREYMAGYVAGENAKQIARRLDTTENMVLVVACNLRKEGVKVPRLNDRLDVRHLNRIIAKGKKEVKSWVA